MRLTKRILTAIAGMSETAKSLDMSAESGAALQDASNWAKEELTRRAELKGKEKEGSPPETPAAPETPATTA